MVWIQLIVLLSLLQLAFFVFSVGKARDTYNVAAPAITGNENFERYYRVQMNTIEQLVIFIPSIILASIYWAPYLMAVLGFIYLVGRMLFFYAYVNGKRRTIPFLMGFIPTIFFIFAGLAGVLRALISAH